MAINKFSPRLLGFQVFYGLLGLYFYANEYWLPLFGCFMTVGVITFIINRANSEDLRTTEDGEITEHMMAFTNRHIGMLEILRRLPQTGEYYTRLRAEYERSEDMERFFEKTYTELRYDDPRCLRKWKEGKAPGDAKFQEAYRKSKEGSSI